MAWPEQRGLELRTEKHNVDERDYPQRVVKASMTLPEFDALRHLVCNANSTPGTISEAMYEDMCEEFNREWEYMDERPF